MLADTFCQTFIENTLPMVHKKRVISLSRQVESLLNNAELTLSSLGRHLKGPAKVKHKITMTWRFLNNPGIHKDSLAIYQAFASTYLPTTTELRIGIDWSGCCSKENYLLRASLLHDGRSIPIYNEVHPVEKQEDDAVHIDFLDKLAQIVPQDCRIIIVTDAGFKTPWFNKVAQLGWYFVGRVRGKIYCQFESEASWQPAKAMHEKVRRGETRFLGKGKLGKTSKTQQEVYFIGHFGHSKGRKKPKKAARYPDAEKMYSSLNSEPWIIATNLDSTLSGDIPKKPVQIACIVRSIYKKRMQIEQNFRDDKNPRFGFGWRYSRTRDTLKISVLCLIAMIATLILWLIGFTAEKEKLHYDFQANTIKSHRVLSYFFLARQVILHTLNRLKIDNLLDAINLFQSDYFSKLEVS